MSEVDPQDTQQVDAFEPLKSAPADIRQIIERVLTLEQERLYQRQPHLNDDVLRIIKDEVK